MSSILVITFHLSTAIVKKPDWDLCANSLSPPINYLPVSETLCVTVSVMDFQIKSIGASSEG